MKFPLPANWYYRDCAIENCDKSAHWERICKICEKHICAIHIGYHSRTCVKCMDEQAKEEKKEKVKKRNIRKKEQEEKLNQLRKEKSSKKEKSGFEKYFEISFFRGNNLHRIRRKEQ